MQRNLAIDGLRGVLLVLMTLDHLLFFPFPHWVKAADFTYGLFGHITAAEGFFFLSGLVCAWLHESIRRKSGKEQAASRLYARVREIYRWNLIALVAVVALAVLLPHQAGAWSFRPDLFAFVDKPLKSMLLACILLSIPPFLNVLPMYFIFLSIAPSVLRSLHGGKVYRVLLFSIGSWLLASVNVWSRSFVFLRKSFPSMPFDGGFFDPFAWQLIFVAGLFVGYYSAKRKLPAWLCGRSALTVAAIISIAALLDKHLWHFTANHLAPAWTSVPRLGAVRLVAFAAIAVVVARYISRRPTILCWRPLVMLGQNSLHVFVWHTVLIFVLALAVFAPIKQSPLTGVPLLMVSLASLWLPVYIRRFRLARNRFSSGENRNTFAPGLAREA